MAQALFTPHAICCFDAECSKTFVYCVFLLFVGVLFWHVPLCQTAVLTLYIFFCSELYTRAVASLCYFDTVRAALTRVVLTRPFFVFRMLFCHGIPYHYFAAVNLRFWEKVISNLR